MVEQPEIDGPIPVGYVWLRRHFNLQTTKPFVTSYLASGARRTEVHGHRIIEFYPRHYGANLDGPLTHLRFALRNEPVDLRVLVATLRAIGADAITQWVRDEPTGGYSRKAWFFYETFLGERLALPDVRTGNYVEAIDPAKHVTGKRINSSRHRVIDNLLGNADLCPMVRRTPRLSELLGSRIDAEARELLQSYDPTTLARAINFLFTKETRSSFAIEGENPTPNRSERFVAALREASRFNPADKQQIIALQNKIVDPRYAAADWRDFQNFVGSTAMNYREQVHFICPKPNDVLRLMEGWAAMGLRVAAGVEPIVAAAVCAFAFVFIHPFEDGNGRIHRFLMHHVLAQTKFSPEGAIFPVSAAIIRDQRGYDEVLEGFSKPLFRYIEWHFDIDQSLIVENDTIDLYRFFDATPFTEYLGDRIIDTVRQDLKGELHFIAIFDLAVQSITRIVDMPDRRAGLFVRLCMQNACRLSAAKRSLFAELSDVEVSDMERAIQQAVDAVEQPNPEQPRLL